MTVFKCLSAEKSVLPSNYVISENLLCCACQGYANVDIDAMMAQA